MPGDAHQPAGKSRRVSQLPQPAIGLQENLLAQFLGLVQAARGIVGYGADQGAN